MRKINDILIFWYNFVKQFILYPIKKKTNVGYKKIEINKNLKNTYQGKRCFILGNGPSLKKESLFLLHNNYVFTVNQIARNSQFDNINPVAHFWVDDNFFKIDTQKEEDLELLRMMKAVPEQKKDTLCFYPLKQEQFIKKHRLDNENVRYLLPELRISESYNFKADLTRYTPNFGTVVQHAIYVAIYMGFKEIYLLGCDSTGIISTLNAKLQSENSTYSYKVTENEKKRMESMVDSSDITSYAYSYYMTLQGFKILKKYCDKRKIKLVNLSCESVLDMLPRQSLEDVICNI